MSTLAEKLKEELNKLSAADRADIACFLLRSLDGTSEEIDDVEWAAELERRSEELRSGRVVGEPADQVLAELRKKYS